ncbi:hypothetical protein NEUTE2DRAFT_126627 [Neurospora tetrasperma FGSC 2509]|nr:hypothetical protein NEUTE2DRAFT_126627 [Neurospora tetrasperma FGSC 2509]
MERLASNRVDDVGFQTWRSHVACALAGPLFDDDAMPGGLGGLSPWWVLVLLPVHQRAPPTSTGIHKDGLVVESFWARDAFRDADQMWLTYASSLVYAAVLGFARFTSATVGLAGPKGRPFEIEVLYHTLHTSTILLCQTWAVRWLSETLKRAPAKTPMVEEKYGGWVIEGLDGRLLAQSRFHEACPSPCCRRSVVYI